MIGDLGGVTEIVMLLFGFFLFPIAEFSFNIKAMKKWYFVRTNDSDLVEDCDKHKKDGVKKKINKDYKEGEQDGNPQHSKVQDAD